MYFLIARYVSIRVLMSCVLCSYVVFVFLSLSCIQLLERGETLDNLMEKSEDLSATSVTFYKKAKEQNCMCS